MIAFRRFATALALCLGFAAPASATVHSTDFTDLWYNAAESGWGFNVIQQGNTLFGTLFVYTNDSSARWFVAPDMKPQETAAGGFKFGGKLYQTTGPFFGTVPFDSSQVVVTEVGDISITFPNATSGTLVYNVGATVVTKQVTRQTFVSNNTAGVYIGGLVGVTSACGDSRLNGAFANFLGDLSGAVNGSTVTFRLDYFVDTVGPAACNFSGTYSQQGRLGAVPSGIWSCASSTQLLNNGTFSLTNIDVQVNGLTATAVATDQFCTYTGRFGGIRNVGTQ